MTQIEKLNRYFRTDGFENNDETFLKCNIRLLSSLKPLQLYQAQHSNSHFFFRKKKKYRNG